MGKSYKKLVLIYNETVNCYFSVRHLYRPSIRCLINKIIFKHIMRSLLSSIFINVFSILWSILMAFFFFYSPPGSTSAVISLTVEVCIFLQRMVESNDFRIGSTKEGVKCPVTASLWAVVFVLVRTAVSHRSRIRFTFPPLVDKLVVNMFKFCSCWYFRLDLQLFLCVVR